jgi:hypothetical protein
MASSHKLKGFFSHSKLRQVIATIHTSKHRRERLKKQLDMDADFRGFVDLMLEELGYLKEGRFSAS